MDVSPTQPLLPYIRYAEYAVRDKWHFPERRLLDYLFIYIQEGQLWVTAEGIKHSFGAGDICVLQPNDLHEFHIASPTITPYVHLDIFYNERREQSFMTKPGQVDLSAYAHFMQPRLNDLSGVHIPLKLSASLAARCKDAIMKLVGGFGHTDIIDRLETQITATELVAVLLRHYRSVKESPPSHSRSHDLKWITSYFSSRLSDPLTLADMAHRAQLSPSRFSAVFRQQFGVSPYRYLLHMRIQHAEELLRRSALTLHEIAAYCGFANEHHFSYSFKKMTGQSPGAYRSEAKL
ncbi:AraC family transcriptional regulator [Paenibacillus nanensis]|uniref:AraC family transcriptional regulator n=1 Tax=Paenibacillus nanensis TaxID=393251 RepID=A0A3A1UXG7_9BACL|nr:AraC family transcriptional regulator [Paenibacillus nanensis]RIX52406.1 AraC family transcriptional regulator [Paenibacillus nanensis]